LTQTYVDTNGWQSVETYSAFADDLTIGTNTLRFETANEYMGSLDIPLQALGTNYTNPAGLIYEAEICYTVVDQKETAWGNGVDFRGANWGMRFGYVWMCPICDCEDSVEVRFYHPFSGVVSTAGWSTTDSPKDLGISSLSILNGDATVYGYRGSNPSTISQRGTRGLGIWGGYDPDEIDPSNTASIADDERIDVIFTEPYCISGVEVRSLFNENDDVTVKPEKAQVDLYQGITLSDSEIIDGVYALNINNGTASSSFVAEEPIDKMVFRIPDNRLPTAVIGNEFAIAGFTVCPWQFEWE
jgi:hypothetical protein